MKVLHLSQSDSIGGAARAAYRLHYAQLKYGIESRMLVRIKKTDDWTVVGPDTKIGKLQSMIRPAISSQLNKLQKSDNANYHSSDWLPSRWHSKINKSDVDIVNLHWVAGETMSIRDIGKIEKPIIWTLHDMWPFCGTEHVTDYGIGTRWRNGYTKSNRSVTSRGLDLDRYSWLYKMRSWKKNMHIISPSRWLAECAKESVLFRDYDITVIPNTLDTCVYKPLPQDFCRRSLNLPDDKKLILFGAMSGGKDINKGYDLLVSTLNDLSVRSKIDDIICLVFGQSKPQHTTKLPFETYWLGHIYDDVTLALLYNAATVMVVPSRQENLPQTATEAQACGTPVISFDCTGLTDVVIHNETGYLAKAYDTQDMAIGLQWVLENPIECKRLGENARVRAEKLWSMKTIVEQYSRIYIQSIDKTIADS